MVRNIASHIADNQTERDVNDVERRIARAGPEGILKGKLKDQLRGIRKRDFQDVLESLEESGRDRHRANELDQAGIPDHPFQPQERRMMKICAIADSISRGATTSKRAVQPVRAEAGRASCVPRLHRARP